LLRSDCPLFSKPFAKVAEIIKRELKRGRIPVERKIIEGQQNEYVKRRLENFNDFILKIKELGERPPKSTHRNEYIRYRHKLDELVCAWDELLECLPHFTRDELREFIGREVKGGEGRERCFDIALMLAARDEPMSFGEIAKKARWLKSFAGLSDSSLNKTLSRVLKSLKRTGLVVKATYYFRLFNLGGNPENLASAPGRNGADAEIFERYLAKILKEISNLRESVDRMNEMLIRTVSYSDPFIRRLRGLPKANS